MIGQVGDGSTTHRALPVPVSAPGSVAVSAGSAHTCAAYASGEEQLKGTLELGKLGDITVLSQDILAVPGREILNTAIFATIVDGKVVYGG